VCRDSSRIAENIERIYKQNCQNLGLLTSTNFALIDRIRAGEEIALSEFTAGEDEITKQVIEYGGLFFPFNVARMQGKVFVPPIKTPARAMTLAEKIFAAHMLPPASETAELRSAGRTNASVPTRALPTHYVRPGDTGFTRVICGSAMSTSRLWRPFFTTERRKDVPVNDASSIRFSATISLFSMK